jgi:hypothetical protein
MGEAQHLVQKYNNERGGISQWKKPLGGPEKVRERKVQ